MVLQEDRLHAFCQQFAQGNEIHELLKGEAFDEFRTLFEQRNFRAIGTFFQAINHAMGQGEPGFSTQFAAFVERYGLYAGYRERWEDAGYKLNKPDIFDVKLAETYVHSISGAFAALPYFSMQPALSQCAPLLTEEFVTALACESIQHYFDMRVRKLSEQRLSVIDFDTVIQELDELGFSVDVTIDGNAVQSDITATIIDKRNSDGRGVDFSDTILMQVCGGDGQHAREV